MPDLDMTQPILPDVGQLMIFKTPETETETGGSRLEFR